MNTKATGNFSKVRKLITVLKKCNGKTVIGDGSAGISPKVSKILAYGGLLALTIALFMGAYFIQPITGTIITLKSLTLTLMMILLIMSFVVSVKDIVTVLYTADDLEQLLPMPFSADQIVMAKLVVASAFPVIVSLVVLNSLCLGYGIRAGAGAAFIIGTVLSSVLIPVTGISAAALLVVIVFRLFGFVRNRDFTVAIGAIFTFGLSIAYMYISSKLRSGESGETATAAFTAFSAVSQAFPNISFMNRFMFAGSISGLLISVAVTAVIFMLALFAVRAFYLSTALSMQNTGTRKKAVSKETLRSGKKNSALKALTVYEAKSSRRNPAYMIYGFVISFLWPVLFALPLVFDKDSVLTRISFPLDTLPALLCFMSFAATASCFSCGFNILPGSAFSREGSTFGAIRAMPVDFRDYYRSKRNFSMLICSLGSVLYVVILGIVCVAAGFISVGSSWTVIPGILVSFLLDLTFVNLLLLKNSGHPRFDWDSETELARKLGVINLIIIVIGVLMLTVFIASLVMTPMLTDPAIGRIILIICTASTGVILVLALVIDHLAVRKAAGNLMKLE